MAGELGRQPDIRTFDLDGLVDLVSRGRIRVPRFRRSYRWDLKDVLRLLDSIVKGYPVGSLLLWQRRAAADVLSLGAVTIEAPAVDQALWVVDGQQRIISLVNALSDDGYRDDKFSVSLDLPSMNFVASKDADPVQHVPLPSLFDLSRLLMWFQGRPHLVEYLSRVNEIASALRNYKIPAYVVRDTESEVLQEIFYRMSSYGKQLSRADIFSALTSPGEGGSDGLTLTEIAEAAEADLSFGRIDKDTVLHVLLAAHGTDVIRDVRHDLTFEDRAAAYDLANQALRRAVGFLQGTLGVPHITFLPYRYLLVVIARFLAYYPQPMPRNRELLVRWYWRAAVVGPDRGSITETMRALAQCITEEDESGSVQGLLGYLRGRPWEMPSAAVFSSRAAGSRILLGALWSLEPRRITTGEKMSYADLARVLSGTATANEVAVPVVRRADLSPEVRRSAGNRLLSESPGDGRTVREVLENLDPVRDEAVLRSQLIDRTGLELLRKGEQEEFVIRRARQIDQQVEVFLTRITGSGLEDTPPLESLVLDDDDDDDDDMLIGLLDASS